VKFQIQRELGAKPETSKAANGTKDAPGLTEWLVHTLLLVRADEPEAGSNRGDWSGPPQSLKNGAFDGRRRSSPSDKELKHVEWHNTPGVR
jgi:hypothetical protein